MLRQIVDRISCWYERQSQDKQFFLFIGFCLVFIILLGLSIRFIPFRASGGNSTLPQHIGRPSGTKYTDSLTHQKH